MHCFITMCLLHAALCGVSPNTARACGIRPQATTQADGGPRPGSYKILGYGAGSVPLLLGSFTLTSGGAYTYYNAAKKPLGTGKYGYSSATKAVEWISGPFKENQWGEAFEISREGKTHLLRLSRNTIGTNSTDAK